MIAGIVWIALAIFILKSGYQRVGLSMLLPIFAPVFLLDWCYKTWHKQPTN